MLSDRAYCLKERVFSRLGPLKEILAFNRATRERWVAEEASQVFRGARVLDVGAGSCPFRDLFAHCHYVAQDLATLEPMQLQGRKGYGRLDVISDIAQLPFADETFDVVLCTEVLEHVPEPIRAVQEIARILRRGGTLLLSAPLRSGLHQEPYHFYGGFTRYWYSKFLTEAGFEQIQIKPVGGLFKMYGESSLHVTLALSPWTIGSRSFALRLTIFSVWLITLAWFAVLCPLLCHVLDGFLPLEWGTVGYHVKAIKGCGIRSLSASEVGVEET